MICTYIHTYLYIERMHLYNKHMNAVLLHDCGRSGNSAPDRPEAVAGCRPGGLVLSMNQPAEHIL